MEQHVARVASERWLWVILAVTIVLIMAVALVGDFCWPGAL